MQTHYSIGVHEHQIKDTVVCDGRDDPRTHKVFHYLEQICYEMDLSNPIWPDTAIRDFQRTSRARFWQTVSSNRLIFCIGTKKNYEKSGIPSACFASASAISLYLLLEWPFTFTNRIFTLLLAFL